MCFCNVVLFCISVVVYGYNNIDTVGIYCVVFASKTKTSDFELKLVKLWDKSMGVAD